MTFFAVSRNAAVIVCVAGAVLSAQSKQKTPVFKGGTSLVTVDAYPTHNGRVVEGLTPEDFEIFEDGKRQAVESLEFVPFDGRLTDDDRPVQMSSREGLELAADPRYRVTVFVIDRAAFFRENWLEMRDALLDFLETTVEPRDLIDIISTDDQWQNLSLGRRLGSVEQEIDDPEWLLADPSESVQVLQGCAVEGLQPRIRADATYTMLEGVVRLLGQAREDHSSIVFISDGLSTAPADTHQQNSLSMPRSIGLVNGRIQPMASATDMHTAFCKREAQRLRDTSFAVRFDELTRVARASNVAFYPIAVESLVPFTTAVMRGHGFPVEMPQGGVMGRGRAGIGPLLSRGFDRARASLAPLAAATGGLSVISGTNVREGLRRIADDVGPHYLIRYYTTNSKRDGGIRTIKVRLKKDGSEIRSRRWYRAPTAEDVKGRPADRKALERIVPAPVANALAPLTKIKPSAQFFAYGAIAGSTLTVVLEVPPEAVEAGRWHDGAEIHLLADAAAGETVGTARGRLAPNGRAVVQVPLDGLKRPSSLMVHVRAEGEAVTERVTVGANPNAFVGDPLGYRSSSRGLSVPVASFVFAADEKLSLQWPLLQPIDRAEARLLDRFGEPLKYGIDVKAQDAGAARRLVSTLKFSNLGRGDYVLELTVSKGAATERNLTALRVR
jgi:VWFA-related protein